jgi:uncharacterized protein
VQYKGNYPPLHIFDPKGYLSSSNYYKLNEKILQIYLKNNFEILVIVIDEIRGRETSIEFAQSVFDKLKADDPVRNNGTMVLFIVEDKKIEFQIGKDAQYLLTKSCESIPSEIIPSLKLSKYYEVYLRIY